MRIFAISDIHGNYNALIELLTISKFNANEDHLFILGDMIDWGYKSVDVLDYIMDLHKNHPKTIHPLLGNHEMMMISAMNNVPNNNAISCWVNNAGYLTLNGFRTISSERRDEIIEWVKSLPLEISFKNYVFVHSITRISPESLRKSEKFDFKILHPEFTIDDILKVWERVDLDIKQADDNHILVAGHTITQMIAKNFDITLDECEVYFDFDKNYINIDCGAKAIDYQSSGQTSYKLALIQLPEKPSTDKNDYRIWYSTQKSNIE